MFVDEVREGRPGRRRLDPLVSGSTYQSDTLWKGHRIRNPQVHFASLPVAPRLSLFVQGVWSAGLPLSKHLCQLSAIIPCNLNAWESEGSRRCSGTWTVRAYPADQGAVVCRVHGFQDAD
jgi:hypothetical protein